MHALNAKYASSHLDDRDSFFRFSGATRFLSMFRFLLFPYALFWMWTQDWALYHSLSTFLSQPPGLLAHIPFVVPNATVAFTLCGIATFLCLPVLVERGLRFNLAALAFTCIYAFLEAAHNTNGFVDARIHLLWFLLATSFSATGEREAASERHERNSIIVRLMELVVVLVYVQAGIAKLVQSGLSWASEGTTLQIGALRQGLSWGEYLAQYEGLARALSWGSLGLELAFVFYFPLKKLRLPLLLGTIVFHLGTQVTMGIDFSHLWIFSLAILLFFPTHVSWGQVSALLDARARSQTWKFVFDSNCGLCNAFVNWAKSKPEGMAIDFVPGPAIVTEADHSLKIEPREFSRQAILIASNQVVRGTLAVLAVAARVSGVGPAYRVLGDSWVLRPFLYVGYRIFARFRSTISTFLRLELSCSSKRPQS
jgi:predicted DCC family thiol-disulfide oxidoreductase YuxK